MIPHQPAPCRPLSQIGSGSFTVLWDAKGDTYGDPTLLRSGAVPTFATAGEAVIALHAGRWKNSTTVDDWRSGLGTYLLPAIGSMRVDEITTADVMDCLSPIWNAKPETARRVRQRVARVMRWTMAQGYRQDNPAGDTVLAALPKQERRQKHHRALPHREVAAAVDKVREATHVNPTVRLAFEFVVLTAARSGEARWSPKSQDHHPPLHHKNGLHFGMWM